MNLKQITERRREVIDNVRQFVYKEDAIKYLDEMKKKGINYKIETTHPVNDDFEKRETLAIIPFGIWSLATKIVITYQFISRNKYRFIANRL